MALTPPSRTSLKFQKKNVKSLTWKFTIIIVIETIAIKAGLRRGPPPSESIGAVRHFRKVSSRTSTFWKMWSVLHLLKVSAGSSTFWKYRSGLPASKKFLISGERLNTSNRKRLNSFLASHISCQCLRGKRIPEKSVETLGKAQLCTESARRFAGIRPGGWQMSED